MMMYLMLILKPLPASIAHNGNEEGSMNQLVMFRVLKDRILSRADYEYFVS